MHTHKYNVVHNVEFCTKFPSVPSPHSTIYTIVSFLFPKEYSDFLSFLVLCDMGEESTEDGDEEGDVVGQGIVLPHVEVGADWEVCCG